VSKADLMHEIRRLSLAERFELLVAHQSIPHPRFIHSLSVPQLSYAKDNLLLLQAK
jgi:hypothetical protein